MLFRSVPIRCQRTKQPGRALDAGLGEHVVRRGIAREIVHAGISDFLPEPFGQRLPRLERPKVLRFALHHYDLPASGEQLPDDVRAGNAKTADDVVAG